MSDIAISPIHVHMKAEDCFTVMQFSATATNSGVRVGVGILVNNIAKNLFIYRAVCNNNDTGEADVTITYGTAIDTNFTSAITPVNQNRASVVGSLATVKGSPANATAPTGTTGTVRAIYRLTGSNEGLELFTNGSGILIPQGTANQAVNFYVKVPTAAKAAFLSIEYIEY